MPYQVEVSSRVVGNTDEDLSTILLEIFEERITLAELIRRTVEEQISQMLSVKRLEAARVEELLQRQYLTADDITNQANRGVIRYPNRKKDQSLTIDVARESERALNAFQQGKFLVFASGRQYTRLDDELDFSQQTKVILLRLMPLVGG